MSEFVELLHFARNLNTCDWENLEQLQGGLNAYLAKISGSRLVFQVYISKEEAVIQVVGEKKLPREIRKITPADFDSLHEELPLNPWPKQIVEVPVEWSNILQMHILFIDPPANFMGENARMLVDSFLGVCACALFSCFKLNEEKRAKDRCRLLLVHSSWMLSNLGDIGWLGGEALVAVRRMVEAERGILFILTPDRNNVEIIAIDPMESTYLGSKVPISNTFESYLLSSSNAIRAYNTVGNVFFYSNVDEKTSYVTRNLLAFPLKDGTNTIIGGVKLSNKLGGFEKLDEDIAGHLAGLCTSALLHGALHTRMRQGQARAMVSTALLNHVRDQLITPAEVTLVLEGRSQLDQTMLAKLTEFSWNTREASWSESLAMCMIILDRLNITRLVHASRTTIAHFLLKLRSAYRNIAYHNWSHAFAVGHFLYCLIYRLDLVANGWLTELEAITMFIAGLCHDVDHRGTTNSFHVKIRSNLAKLYGSEGSIMEHHHFAQTLEILGSEGCNIYQNIDVKQYREVLGFVRDRILDTDLVLHLTSFGEKRNFLHSKLGSELREYSGQVLPLLMTASDLSDATKEWRATRDSTASLYKEFFVQGDMEKAMGHTPAPMIDREKVDIVDMQIHFMSDIVTPCYSLLSEIFPQLEILVYAIREGMKRWERTRSFYTNGRAAGRPPLEIISDPGFITLATT